MSGLREDGLDALECGRCIWRIDRLNEIRATACTTGQFDELSECFVVHRLTRRRPCNAMKLVLGHDIEGDVPLRS